MKKEEEPTPYVKVIESAYIKPGAFFLINTEAVKRDFHWLKKQDGTMTLVYRGTK